MRLTDRQRVTRRSETLRDWWPNDLNAWSPSARSTPSTASGSDLWSDKDEVRRDSSSILKNEVAARFCSTGSRRRLSPHKNNQLTSGILRQKVVRRAQQARRLSSQPHVMYFRISPACGIHAPSNDKGASIRGYSTTSTTWPQGAYQTICESMSHTGMSGRKVRLEDFDGEADSRTPEARWLRLDA